DEYRRLDDRLRFLCVAIAQRSVLFPTVEPTSGDASRVTIAERWHARTVRREALLHLVARQGVGEHREVDRRQGAVQVVLERRARLRARLPDAVDGLG